MHNHILVHTCTILWSIIACYIYIHTRLFTFEDINGVYEIHTSEFDRTDTQTQVTGTTENMYITCTHVYIYVYIYVYTCIYIYICTYKENI